MENKKEDYYYELAVEFLKETGKSNPANRSKEWLEGYEGGVMDFANHKLDGRM